MTPPVLHACALSLSLRRSATASAARQGRQLQSWAGSRAEEDSSDFGRSVRPALVSVRPAWPELGAASRASTALSP